MAGLGARNESRNTEKSGGLGPRREPAAGCGATRCWGSALLPREGQCARLLRIPLRNRLRLSFLRWPIFGFWVKGQNVVGPIVRISSTPENVHFPTRNPSDTRHPICGKMDTPKLLNVPIYTRRSRRSAACRRSTWRARGSRAGAQEARNTLFCPFHENFISLF